MAIIMDITMMASIWEEGECMAEEDSWMVVEFWAEEEEYWTLAEVDITEDTMEDIMGGSEEAITEGITEDIMGIIDRRDKFILS